MGSRARWRRSNHIRFVLDVEESKGKKTKVFEIVSKHDSWSMGGIRWDTGWRRYIFLPDNATKWDLECLKDVMSKLKALMRERLIKNGDKQG